MQVVDLDLTRAVACVSGPVIASAAWATHHFARRLQPSPTRCWRPHLPYGEYTVGQPRPDADAAFRAP